MRRIDLFLLISIIPATTLSCRERVSSYALKADISNNSALEQTTLEYNRLFGQKYSFHINELHTTSGCEKHEVQSTCAIAVVKMKNEGQRGSAIELYDKEFGKGTKDPSNNKVESNNSWHGTSDGLAPAASQQQTPRKSAERRSSALDLYDKAFSSQSNETNSKTEYNNSWYGKSQGLSSAANQPQAPKKNDERQSSALDLYDKAFSSQSNETNSKTEYNNSWYGKSQGLSSAANQPQAPKKNDERQSSALDLYDKEFEQKEPNNSDLENDNNIKTWHGYELALAATIQQEPMKNVVKNGVTFKPNDIRALLKEVYTSNAYMLLGGSRCKNATVKQRGDQTKMSSCEGINPATLHLSLFNFIGRQNSPIILGETSDATTSNSSIVKFSTELKEGNLSVVRAYELIGDKAKGMSTQKYVFNSDSDVVLRHISTTIQYLPTISLELQGGLEFETKTYDYILELRKDGNDFRIVGGEWINNSINDHPDFLWRMSIPSDIDKVPNSQNGLIDHNEILKLWKASIEN